MASTRLTNVMRDTFIEQVINGIPVKHPFDLQDVKEQILKRVESNLPVDIKSFAKKYPYLIKRNKNIYLPECLTGGRYRTITTIDHESCKMIDCSEFELQLKNHENENEARAKVRGELYSVAYACTTVEKLKLALPELESYMPKANDRQLPIAVPTDVVVENLMRAGLKVPK